MAIFGSIVAGYMQDRLGRRAVFLLAVIFAAAGIAANFVANNPAQFLSGKIITGFANLGFLIAISSTFSRVSIMDKSAFRVLFAGA
ncbi:hypothetical protein C8A01DRAFT_41588 [Parachaetomium inaequale]|uniref:Major facilitator superfamily (MFS) profile domain-containing protein n=1 Tax=Parachaetomium inaequale TaxID=2588326 RepID=A0AAN6P8Y8_9PEZI|nr:hypothetical protein C8A01DRAFT_41588 [Parachaetomium inaequale]